MHAAAPQLLIQPLLATLRLCQRARDCAHAEAAVLAEGVASECEDLVHPAAQQLEGFDPSAVAHPTKD